MLACFPRRVSGAVCAVLAKPSILALAETLLALSMPCLAATSNKTTCNGQLNAAQHASKQPMSSMASRHKAAPTVALVRAVCFYRRFAVATTVTILQAARAGLLLVQSGDGGMHSTAASRRRIEERVQTHQGARARPIWFVRLHADTGDGHWWVDSDVFCTQVLACMHSSDGCHLYMQQLAPGTTHPSRTGALVPHCQSLWDCQHHPAGHGRVQHAKQMCCCAQRHNSDTLTGRAARRRRLPQHAPCCACRSERWCGRRAVQGCRAGRGGQPGPAHAQRCCCSSMQLQAGARAGSRMMRHVRLACMGS
jgi:hypothetical protein